MSQGNYKNSWKIVNNRVIISMFEGNYLHIILLLLLLLRPPPLTALEIQSPGLSAGKYHTCGIQLNSNGLVKCWGDNGFNGQATPPSNTYFSIISAGGNHNCGIQLNSNGLVLCWGSNYYNQATPPSNTCLLYTSPSPRDRQKSRMPSSA